MIQADNLIGLAGLRHGFFTRQGGVSEGAFDSLNCGYSGGDEAERVIENRTRALANLDLPPDSLCTVRQVHGADVVVARTPIPGLSQTRADALVTDRLGVTLGVLCADCAPVLIADREARVIGCAHAGWRGALAGVIEATVDVMIDLGAERERICAAVGPCIAQASYEVGPDFRDQIVGEDAGTAALFESIAGSDRPRFDLKAYALHRLARAGVLDRRALTEDTYADEISFFSARRTRQRGAERFGLLLSMIALVD